MNKLKNFFSNNFAWYCMSAFFSAVLCACYTYQREAILAIAWGAISICDIGIAALNRWDPEV